MRKKHSQFPNAPRRVRIASSSQLNPLFEFSDVEQDQLVAKVLTGGYPSVMELNESRRTGWHNAYVRSIVDRDIEDVVRIN